MEVDVNKTLSFSIKIRVLRTWRIFSFISKKFRVDLLEYKFFPIIIMVIIIIIIIN
jgi:hypothetical protein